MIMSVIIKGMKGKDHFSLFCTNSEDMLILIGSCPCSISLISAKLGG